MFFFVTSKLNFLQKVYSKYELNWFILVQIRKVLLVLYWKLQLELLYSRVLTSNNLAYET